MSKADRKKSNAFVEERLGAGPICDRCGATLATFAEACTADLTDQCPGFLAIDSAKAEFAGPGSWRKP